MGDHFAWHFKLQGSPSEVFESLLRAADGGGRLRGVDEVGAALTYAPVEIDESQHGWVRATVRPCADGALIDIEPTVQAADVRGDVAAEAASVASLISHLRRYYPDEVFAAADGSAASGASGCPQSG